MRSLKSVSHLESLHKGSKAAARHKSRQPVRRKRGDVHGDLMALVLRFDWPGEDFTRSKCSFSGFASLYTIEARCA